MISFSKNTIKQNLYFFANSIPMKSVLKHWRNPVSIFCFHRVLPADMIEGSYDPNRELIISTDFFDSFLERLGESHRFCTMDEAVEHLNGNSQELTAHITFDDGYKDNLQYALPILEKHNVPATVYVTTRFAEGDAWMWWFELWEIVEGNQSISYVLNDEQILLQCRSAEEKRNTFKHLRDRFSKMSIATQKEVLHSMAGSDTEKSYYDSCLHWDEIKWLDQQSLITIGAHTHSHPNLAVESDDSVEYELVHSKSLLEKKIGRSVRHFAYPFGGKDQYGDREAGFAKSLGYASAVTATCKKWRNDSLYELPRYIVTESSSPSVLNARISGLCNLLSNQLL